MAKWYSISKNPVSSTPVELTSFPEIAVVRDGPRSLDAVSEATAYAWEHWHEVRAMENPAGYLYRVGQSRTRTRKLAALPQPEVVGLPDIEPALIPALLALPETQRTPGRLARTVKVIGLEHNRGAVPQRLGRDRKADDWPQWS